MSLKKKTLAFIVIGALGTLFHFAYDFLGQNFIAGLFFPVNESVFEHLKLLFYPTVLFSLFEYFTAEEKSRNYWPAVVQSYLCGILTILVLYYTISGIYGGDLGFVNIVIYWLAVLIMVRKKEQYVYENEYSKSAVIFSLIFIVLSALLFAIFTVYPLNYGIFIPPEM